MSDGRDTQVSILLVDDEKDTCDNLSDILTDEGYRVAMAHDGPAALELVQKYPFDVALIDLKMPGMDGLTVYRELKRIQARTVGIIVTAYANSETAEAALRAGAWKILAKPVDVEALFGLVTEVASQPAVLVVDDDKDLCESLWDVLRERGFRACLAHDRAGAVDRIRRADFQVILLDVKLPGDSGVGVLREIRAIDPAVRVLFITGLPRETFPAVQSALAEGVEGVCYKPFDVDLLIRRIDQLSGSARSARA